MSERPSPNLLGLPIELRMPIYDLIFAPDKVVHRLHDYPRAGTTETRFGTSHNILLTCKKCYAEAHELFWYQTPVELSVTWAHPVFSNYALPATQTLRNAQYVVMPVLDNPTANFLTFIAGFGLRCIRFDWIHSWDRASEPHDAHSHFANSTDEQIISRLNIQGLIDFQAANPRTTILVNGFMFLREDVPIGTDDFAIDFGGPVLTSHGGSYVTYNVVFQVDLSSRTLVDPSLEYMPYHMTLAGLRQKVREDESRA